MAHSGPIIIIEDDEDDQELLQDVFKDIGTPNRLIFFESARQTFEYLKTTVEQPFIILSDVNMPQQTGVEFKKQIDEDPALREKSIPFVFFSTFIDKKIVKAAYLEMTIQGFFQKSNKYEELKDTLSAIVDYWKKCRHPNS